MELIFGFSNINHRVNENFTESDNKKYMKDISKLFLLNNSVVKPEDIVNTILFLASDDADFISEEIIENNNGYSLNYDLSYNDTNEYYI